MVIIKAKKAFKKIILEVLKMHYPKEVFNINVDITRRNMQRYDAAQKKIEQAILEEYPDYYKMSFKERWYMRDKIREIEKRFPWY